MADRPSLRRRLPFLALAGLTAFIFLPDARKEASNTTTPAKAEKDMAKAASTAIPAAESAKPGGMTQDPGLWAALEVARREINPLSEHEASLPVNEGVSHFAWNPGQDLTARFRANSVSFGSGAKSEWQVNFAYTGGSGDSQLTVDGGRAEFLHPDGIREWYENQDAGIEHGFTLDRPKAGGPTLEVTLGGMSAKPDGADLLLLDQDGHARLRYAGLKAWDADGRDLLASMSATGNGLCLTVDDTGARYPLTIDPLITVVDQELQPSFTGTGALGEQFGESVAISGDLALIGTPRDDTATGHEAGSVHVFARVGNVWIPRTRLTPKDAKPGALFGAALALHGTTAVIGVPGDSRPGSPHIEGSVRIWSLSNNQWFQQRRINGTPSPDLTWNMGWNVAIHGNRVVAAAPGENNRAGAVYVYTFGIQGWALQQKITPPVNGPFEFGRAISLYGDMLAIGAPATPSRGAAYLYTFFDGTWSWRTIPVPGRVTTGGGFGSTVTLSQDTLLAGAWRGRSRILASFPFPASVEWTGSPIFFNFSTISNNPRISVALDGNLALVGVPDAISADKKSFGIVHSLVRNSSTANWSMVHDISNKSPQVGARFGSSVALDAENALIGASGHRSSSGNGAGIATFFRRSNSIFLNNPQTVEAGHDGSLTQYGLTVAAAGNHVAIAMNAESNADGYRREAVYVLGRKATGWEREARIVEKVEEPYPSRFGSALAMSEGRLVIGIPGQVLVTAPPEGDPVTTYGGAEIHERGEDGIWVPTAAIPGSNEFGDAVAIDGDTAVIGSPYTPDFEGKAFVFEKGSEGWQQTAELLPKETGRMGRFGHALAIDGNTILVGAPDAIDGEGQPAGYVAVLRRKRNQWVQEAKLVNGLDAPYHSARFGRAVALDGDTALVGAPSVNGSSYHFFTRGKRGWSLQDRGYGSGIGELGTTVALKGDVAAVVPSQAPFPGRLLEKRGEQWVLVQSFPEGTSAVALTERYLVTGNPSYDGNNSIDGSTAEGRGQVVIHELARAEGYLVRSFDADDNGSISREEWAATFGNKSALNRAFRSIDADHSGGITPDELVNAQRATRTARLILSMVERASTFMDLDSGSHEGSGNDRVDRREVAWMWRPGTPASVVDSFWKRAGATEGFDLESWLKAPTLPSIPVYQEARVIREDRQRLLDNYDLGPVGIFSREEFDSMMSNEAGIEDTLKSWKALTGHRRGQEVREALTAEEFVEAKNFPVFRK